MLSVEYAGRAVGLIEYVYRPENLASNKGIILDRDIDLSCAQEFEPVALPFPTGAQGYDFPPHNAASHTPAAVIADFGSSFAYGLSGEGSARWGLYLQPGEVRQGLRLISVVKPGMRTYRLIPAMDDDDSWDYPREPDSNLPWIEDFTVTGTIAAPGCPDETRSPSQ